MPRNDALVVGALAVLVVMAGCSGAPTSTAPQSGAAAPTTEPTTPTRSSSTTPTPGDAGTPPLDVSEVRAAHGHLLRERGSVTVQWNASVLTNGTLIEEWRVGRYDFDAGTARITEKPMHGANSTVYVAANGSVYERIGETYHAGPTVYPPNVSGVLRPQFPVSVAPLTYSGETTYRNVTGHVYNTTDTAAFADATETYNRSQVQRVEYGLVLATSGRIELLYINVTVNSGGSTGTITLSRRYSDVGEATVRKPDWLPDAIAAAPTPTPEGPEVRTFELSDDRGRVKETVTAPRGTYWSGAGPEHTADYEFSYDLMFDASVGPIVRLHWPDDATRVETAYHYDEADVPREESTLTMTVYDRENQTIRPVTDVPGISTSVDPEADTVTVVVTGEDAIERYRGNAFIAMDFEYFTENIPTG